MVGFGDDLDITQHWVGPNSYRKSINNFHNLENKAY